MSVGSPKGSTKDLLADHHAPLDFEALSIFGTDSILVHQSTTNGELGGNHERKLRRNRRQKTKVNPEEKQFKCGCGKAYLSYAALYTHCKVKHTGIFPEGTNAGEKKKQGRPKVVDNYARKR
jgi:hypothetical protein